MAKLKLPERFKIQWIEITNQICIHTKEDEFVYCNTLSDVMNKITIYYNLLSKIKEIKIPESFSLKPNLRDDRIMILHNGNIVKSVDIENISEELNKSVNTKLQIQALNNGEEIEL